MLRRPKYLHCKTVRRRTVSFLHNLNTETFPLDLFQVQRLWKSYRNFKIVHQYCCRNCSVIWMDFRLYSGRIFSSERDCHCIYIYLSIYICIHIYIYIHMYIIKLNFHRIAKLPKILFNTSKLWSFNRFCPLTLASQYQYFYTCLNVQNC
jgi:hypothetical protein